MFKLLVPVELGRLGHVARRWRGLGDDSAAASDSESDAEDAQRMVRINNETKRLLTQVLLSVTDSMFGAALLTHVKLSNLEL